MKLPYQGVIASSDKSLAQLQKILQEFGCQRFGIMNDIDRSEVIVQFEWRQQKVELRASWKGYADKLAKYTPSQKQVEQAKKSVCAALKDWVKGQTTIVECGVMSFEEVFMPQLLLPEGGRLIDKAVQFCLPKN